MRWWPPHPILCGLAASMTMGVLGWSRPVVIAGMVGLLCGGLGVKGELARRKDREAVR